MPNWNEVFNEIQTLQLHGANAQTVVRKKYLTLLHQHTGRNLIAYYSGWLSSYLKEAFSFQISTMKIRMGS
jgi:hypothetical protein